jgi:ATP-dependent exoDNAse (exonuclease V) beta subunit
MEIARVADPALRDDCQRQQAVDPRRSFIVQAPAGSGKTGLLMQRYLSLLATVAEPEEIIAITFTRKAAAEMRERVLEALSKPEASVEPKNEHDRRTRALASEALRRDRERGWRLKANPTRLRIQTIDSLCGRLVRQMPLQSSFCAHLEPIDDADDLYRAAARELVAQLEDDSACSLALATVLRHLDNDIGRIERLLADMLARRDRWLRHVVGGQVEMERRAQLEGALRNVICDALQELVAHVPEDLKGDLVDLARFAAKNLKESTSKSLITACDGLERLPGATLVDLGPWRGIAELLLTAKNDWRARCDIGIGFPAGDKDKQLNELCKARKQVFYTVLDACMQNDKLHACLVALRGLPAANYTDTQWRIAQALFELLPLAAAQLDVMFQERAQVDFTGVAQRTLRALGSPQAPSDLALMLDYQIGHLLIDEFQDTSLSQLQLLKGLTAGWEDGDGRTLFAVGDPMQSIYGFREAEVGVFLEVREQGLGGIRPDPLTLTTNFRSQEGVVEWVNEAFKQVFPQVEDMQAGAVKYTQCEAFHPSLDGKAVEVHCFFDDDKTAEAARVVEIVKRSLRQTPKGTIGILVRAKTHLTEIIPKLNAAGLRFRALEIEMLGERPVVQDLKALTRALCHPADRLSWLTVLRAPWCGLTLSDLHTLAGDDLSGPLWELMNDDARCRKLSPDGYGRLKRVRDVFAEALAQRRRRSLRREVEGVWLALGGPATATRVDDLENAQMYLELIEQFDDGGDLTDFAVLETSVERLHAAPDMQADETLQVMTIHKAKGLEFDTVIVPGLGSAPRSESRQLLAWLERTRKGGQPELLIAPIDAKAETDKDPTYTAIRKLVTAKTEHEDKRLVYVAATRAQRHLHLLGHATRNKDGGCKANSRSLLACLWPAVEKDFAKAAALQADASTTGDSGREIKPRLRRASARWVPPSPAHDIELPTVVEAVDAYDPLANNVEFLWAGEAARHIGVVAHRLLQRVAREGIQCWNAARLKKLRSVNVAALAALGTPYDELHAAAELVEQVMVNTFNDDRGRWLFDRRHTDAHAEYALTGLVDGRLLSIKIDRTFVDRNGIRWIVDYKTGTHEGSEVAAFLDREVARYSKQLADYIALMRLKEARPVRAGLYYPLIPGGWREWLQA